MFVGVVSCLLFVVLCSCSCFFFWGGDVVMCVLVV